MQNQHLFCQKNQWMERTDHAAVREESHQMDYLTIYGCKIILVYLIIRPLDEKAAIEILGKYKHPDD